MAATYDVDTLRAREFPWTLAGDITYLDNASTGPLPRRTVEALAEFNALRATPHLVSDELQFGTLARSRELVARLIGARTSEIALASNTGFGINLAASALPLAPRDVVLVPDREFPANVYPWMAHARRRGVDFRQLPCTPDGLLDKEALLRAIEAPDVRLLALSWVSFTTGEAADLARIGAACRARGVFLVVDAIQGLGARTLDLSALQVDVLACGGQKWLLSPWGTGFVYVRDELVRKLEPSWVSWMSVRDSDDFTRLLEYDLTWRDDARRFEQPTLAYQDFAGMNASLELLHELGPAQVAAHVSTLVDVAVEWAEAHRVRLATPVERARRAGIVSLRVSDPEDTSRRLARTGVVHSLREGLVRLSPHGYNTAAEVQRALELLAAR